jgi:hypothetical protein
MKRFSLFSFTAFTTPIMIYITDSLTHSLTEGVSEEPIRGVVMAKRYHARQLEELKDDGYEWGAHRGGGGSPLRNSDGTQISKLGTVINGTTKVDLDKYNNTRGGGGGGSGSGGGIQIREICRPNTSYHTPTRSKDHLFGAADSTTNGTSGGSGSGSGSGGGGGVVAITPIRHHKRNSPHLGNMNRSDSGGGSSSGNHNSNIEAQHESSNDNAGKNNRLRVTQAIQEQHQHQHQQQQYDEHHQDQNHGHGQSHHNSEIHHHTSDSNSHHPHPPNHHPPPRHTGSNYSDTHQHHNSHHQHQNSHGEHSSKSGRVSFGQPHSSNNSGDGSIVQAELLKEMSELKIITRKQAVLESIRWGIANLDLIEECNCIGKLDGEDVEQRKLSDILKEVLKDFLKGKSHNIGVRRLLHYRNEHNKGQTEEKFHAVVSDSLLMLCGAEPNFVRRSDGDCEVSMGEF